MKNKNLVEVIKDTYKGIEYVLTHDIENNSYFLHLPKYPQFDFGDLTFEETPTLTELKRFCIYDIHELLKEKLIKV